MSWTKLFTYDAAITTHSKEDLQQFINRFADACKDFGLTITLRKTEVINQDVEHSPSISITDRE